MFKFINKRYWLGLLIAFIAFDIALTYWQNYQLPLDGDMVTIVLPAPQSVHVLHDPFGWAVITKNEVYTAPSRFFAYAAMGLYWKKMPHLLQAFTTPASSLYVASALFNTIIQTAILFLLAAYVQLGVGGGGRGRWGFWLAAGLLVPLFQTEGFYMQMGITNQAITYTFFYALPITLLLILLWPFYKAAYQQQPLRVQPWQAVLLMLLMVVISFNGPIVMAAVAVLLLGIGIYWLCRQWQMKPSATAPRTLATGWLSGQAIGLLFVLGILNLYSLYIGRNDAENTHTHTLWELYQMLPLGIKIELTAQPGLPLLIALVVVNGLLIRWLVPPSAERLRVLYILRGVGLFALIFVALVPFGGYRVYRPNLIRADIIIPILVGIFFAYGVSTYYLVLQLKNRVRTGYLVLVVSFLGFFAYSDAIFQMPRTNDCERWAFEQMEQSQEPVTHLYVSCPILSWGLMTDAQASDMNADMLQYWGVTSRKKLYYQQ